MKVTISIPEHTKKLLNELAHARRLTMSGCINNLIEEAYANEPRIQKMQLKPNNNNLN